MTNPVPIQVSSSENLQIAFFSEQKAYYRFEVAHFVLRGIEPERCQVVVYRDQSPLPAYLGPQALRFHRRATDAVAFWFHDWNTPAGEYTAVLWVDGVAVSRTPFSYIHRKPVQFERSFTLMNLEFPLQNKNIPDTNGSLVPYEQALPGWLKYGEIDGFLTLAGQTSDFDRVSEKNPWSPVHLENALQVGQILHRQNLLFGAYIMCFYTPEAGWDKAGYQPALTYQQGRVQPTKFTSFTDPKRFQDIVNLAAYLNSLDYVDMIGFDFIRFGERAGYENAREFALDMNIPLPATWRSYTLHQQVAWLGEELKKPQRQQQWRLWKAHKTAELVYRVIQAAGLTKPVWVFTLGWDHGTEHGQDPLMFQDAGVLADLVMLYEASPQMFSSMKKQWTTYLSQEQVNYIPGNQIDAVVNQSLGGRNPVEEFQWRLSQGAEYAPYLSRGVFIHDIHRAFFSRRRSVYSYREWLQAGLSSSTRLRYLKGEIPLWIGIPDETLYTDHYSKQIQLPLQIQIHPQWIPLVAGRTLQVQTQDMLITKKLDNTIQSNITLIIKVNHRKEGANFISLKAGIEGYPSSFAFSYLNIQKKTD